MDLSPPQPLDEVVQLAMNGQSAAARLLLEERLFPHPCEAARWFVVAKLLLADEGATRQRIMHGLLQGADAEAAALARLLDGLALTEHRREMESLLARLESLAHRMEGTPAPAPPAMGANEEGAEATQANATPVESGAELPPPPPKSPGTAPLPANLPLFLEEVLPPPPVPVVAVQAYATYEEIVEGGDLPESVSPSEELVLANLQHFLARLTLPAPVMARDLPETALPEPKSPSAELVLANLERFLARLTLSTPVTACDVPEAAPPKPESPSAEQVLANLERFLARLTLPTPVTARDAQERADQAIGHLETLLGHIQTAANRLVLPRMQRFLEQIQAAGQLAQESI